MSTHGADNPIGGRRIETRESIPAPIDEVWRSWTTSSGVSAFLGVEADIDCRRGGKYKIYFDEAAWPRVMGALQSHHENH